MKITRREFVERTVGSGVALGAVAAWAAESAGGEADRLPIVDTHQHLWDLSKIHPPWLQPGGELTRDYVTRDYLEAARGLNVVKAVYMEVAVADADLAAEAELVLKLCRRDDNPTCAAVIGGRPAAEDFSQYIGRYKDEPYVKGVRHIMREPAMLEAPGLVPGLRLLGGLGMRFDLCVSTGMLAESAKLVDRCGDTRFILDHCGPTRRRPTGVRPRPGSGTWPLWPGGKTSSAKFPESSPK
jgi:predicted TIM-barrel fold metal-dependent hydrolase